MKAWKKDFDKWFSEFFCDKQGEDSPYNYYDITEAFKAGARKKSDR